MGSFDTSESVSRYDSGPYRDTSSSSSRDSGDDGGSSRSRARASSTPEPERTDDYTRPTLVSIGGGLTPARIVKKVDTDYIEKPMIEVINYLIGDDVAVTKEEKNIADTVRERMARTDYRAIINDYYNFHNDRLSNDKLKTYLTPKTRTTENGEMKYNMADIAIVSHEEGGLELKIK